MTDDLYECMRELRDKAKQDVEQYTQEIELITARVARDNDRLKQLREWRQRAESRRGAYQGALLTMQGDPHRSMKGSG